MHPNNQLPKPPKWADKFLEWYCRRELLEEIQGDAYELFYKRTEEGSVKRARSRFIWDVFRSFRLSTIKHLNLQSPVMLKSNIKIALRHLLKERMYSVIKIGGFALGIAACLLIGLYIREEISYDQFYENGNRLYRIVGVFNDDGDILKGVHFPAPLAKVTKEDYPEVELAGRYNSSELFGAGNREVRRADQTQNHHETGFVYFDQELLELLEIPIVQGSPAKALTEPNTVVISESKARKYFPNENAVGKRLIIDNIEDKPLTISAVMSDFPNNSHLDFDFLITLSGVEFWPGEQNFWRASNYATYLRLRPGTDAAVMEEKLMSILDNYIIPSAQEAGDVDYNEIREKAHFKLQAVGDIHLHSEGIRDRMNHGDIRFVWLFGAIAGFILLIACINFVNLSTARSANRAKEVGLRKVVGSHRRQIMGQFLTESVLYSTLSFGVGILLAWALLPYFNELAGKSLAMPWEQWWLLPLVLLAALAVGLIAGIYPAVYLSGFRPMQVLKGQLSRGSKSSGMRNALVVFQFTTSVVLIIGTFVIYQQMHFILNKKVGFDKEQVVILEGANTMGKRIGTFKKELLQLPEVSGATISDYLPIDGTKRNGNSLWNEGKTREEASVGSQVWRVDHDYVTTLGMNILEGRDFSLDMPTDSQAVIINQTLARDLGLDDPVGKRIANSGSVWEVIGVVEDFHFEDMKNEIRPLGLLIGNQPARVSVRVNTENMDKTIAALTRVWEEFSPNQPIRYTFLDERFAVMYADVQRMGRIVTSFAVLAIIVACLGLFALSAYMAEQRSKEMSIRKVLGASVAGIFGKLTQSFLTLVLIALVIAIPLSWYLMRKWLQDYEYRIDIGWQVFVFAGVIALAIALLTVSFQALRAAMDNPIKALNQE
jgi:putative ABC transport system permease protein